jgi:hypothetical protein
LVLKWVNTSVLPSQVFFGIVTQYLTTAFGAYRIGIRAATIGDLALLLGAILSVCMSLDRATNSLGQMYEYRLFLKNLDNAAQTAHATDLIMGLPDIWETMLGRHVHARGQDLSGGQWQCTAFLDGMVTKSCLNGN